jgi:hypothetical protein
MGPRLQLGSRRALLTFIGFVLVFGILAEFNKEYSIINYIWLTVRLVFLLVLSSVIIILMWRKRARPDEFWRSAHRGQIGALPPKWRRWILGEDH